MHEIVLVRHGETEWSRTLRHTGRTNIPLTDAGREQAAVLVGPLGEWDFDRVITSPLGRARETCRLAGLEERAEFDDALVEWDYGEYEGITTAQIRERRPDWNLWRDGCPGGEQVSDLGARVDPLVERLRREDEDVALFAHGHLLRVLTARWLRLPAADGRLFALSTATLSVLGFEHQNAVIRRWNAPVVAPSGNRVAPAAGRRSDPAAERTSR
jgi:broad specificity phosphatase PhoE